MSKALEQYTKEVAASEALSWLRPGIWVQEVEALRKRLEACRRDGGKKATRNRVDPFNVGAMASVYRHTMDTLTGAIAGQATVKCIANPVGDFHTGLLAGAYGWHRHPGRFDLENDAGGHARMFAEVKNKHNTIKKSDRGDYLHRLDEARKAMGSRWEAALVEIIPAKSERVVQQPLPGVWVFDGAAFYTNVSGRPNALHEVLDALLPCLGVDPDVADYLRGLDTLPPREEK